LENLDVSKGNLITYKVHIDLNVLCTLVLNWIAGQVDGTDVVTEHHGGTADRRVKLLEELAKPGHLSNCIGDSTLASALERETVAWRLEDQETRLVPRNTA
jgi:hypothetical protein